MIHESCSLLVFLRSMSVVKKPKTQKAQEVTTVRKLWTHADGYRAVTDLDACGEIFQ
jgi:hypothetical protein